MKSWFNKIKDFFSKRKDRIVNAIKFYLLTWMMSMGFWISYVFIWYALGLPIVNWGMWILLALAFASEWLYIKWLQN